MGASDLGWECCRALFDMQQEVVGILSIPKEFPISWSSTPVTNVRYKSFQDLADSHGVPLINITSKMSDPIYRDIIRQLEPEVLIVIGWYYMVPRSIRDLAPLGAVGIHASLLPKYRGGAPLVWAIINGEMQTGVTLFYFDDGVDNGDIIGQKHFAIDFNDTIADVISKAIAASVHLVRQYVPLLASGKAPRIPQDHAAATIVPQRQPKDGLINWKAQTAQEVHNWVRAQTRPYPGAFTLIASELVRVWRVSLSDQFIEGRACGSIIEARHYDPDGFGVVCSDGQLVIIREIGLADGTVMTGQQFLATRRLPSGTLVGVGTANDV